MNKPLKLTKREHRTMNTCIEKIHAIVSSLVDDKTKDFEMSGDATENGKRMEFKFTMKGENE